MFELYWKAPLLTYSSRLNKLWCGRGLRLLHLLVTVPKSLGYALWIHPALKSKEKSDQHSSVLLFFIPCSESQNRNAYRDRVFRDHHRHTKLFLIPSSPCGSISYYHWATPLSVLCFYTYLAGINQPQWSVSQAQERCKDVFCDANTKDLLLRRLCLQFLLFTLLLFSQNMLMASRCLLTCFILTTRDRKYRPDEESSLNHS